AEHVFSLLSYRKMLSQLLRALKFLHSANVIHRDLKPENIAINLKGHLILLDFGLARAKDENCQATKNAGTSFYRAIEATSYDNSDRPLIYNEKADMWSVGAILCEMIMGTPIFDYCAPVLRAIDLCGPVPDHVINQIGDSSQVPPGEDENQTAKMKYQDLLRTRSRGAKRIDFLAHLSSSKSRSWLHDDVVKIGKDLKDFIDRTLVCDHEKRMSVDEALVHPFLVQFRDSDREKIAEKAMIDDAPSTIEKCKEKIFDLIRESTIEG
ncbi:hypothetical protein PFISCL1PPCAC_15860, partial [Pristionchus fissidentatus]